MPAPATTPPAAVRTGHEFRSAMGRFPTGITVVTTVTSDGAPAGFTCQSLCSVSLDPQLILISVMNTSTTLPLIRRRGSFTVNVLGADMREVSARFGRSTGDKWAGLNWEYSPSRHPVLPGSVLWVDCDVDAAHPAGDHTLVVGRVLQFSAAAGEEPLVFSGGRYRTLAAEPGS